MDGSGWIVEDCSHGTILIFKGDTLAYKWSNRYFDGTVGITSWCRYISEEEILKYQSFDW